MKQIIPSAMPYDEDSALGSTNYIQGLICSSTDSLRRQVLSIFTLVIHESFKWYIMQNYSHQLGI